MTNTNHTDPEPVYFIEVNRSGVFFAASSVAVPDGATVVSAHRVDPTIRREGTVWLLAQWMGWSIDLRAGKPCPACNGQWYDRMFTEQRVSHDPSCRYPMVARWSDDQAGKASR